MGLWSSIFGSGLRELSGWYVSVPKEDVLSGDTSLVERNMHLLDEYVVANGKHYSIEMSFDGWERDGRPIFNIPEIVSWCELVQERHADFIIFLSPGPLLRFSMCIDRSFWTWETSGQLVLESDRPVLTQIITIGTVMATMRLQQLGLDQSGVLALAESVKSNIEAAFSKAQYELGTHYGVILPAQDTRLGEP